MHEEKYKANIHKAIVEAKEAVISGHGSPDAVIICMLAEHVEYGHEEEHHTHDPANPHAHMVKKPI